MANIPTGGPSGGTSPTPTPGADVPPTTSTGAAPDVSTKAPSAYMWLLAWGVFLALMALINQTRVGHAAIYYGLLIILFFLILSNYRFIATALAPIDTLNAG